MRGLFVIVFSSLFTVFSSWSAAASAWELYDPPMGTSFVRFCVTVEKDGQRNVMNVSWATRDSDLSNREYSDMRIFASHLFLMTNPDISLISVSSKACTPGLADPEKRRFQIDAPATLYIAPWDDRPGISNSSEYWRSQMFQSERQEAIGALMTYTIKFECKTRSFAEYCNDRYPFGDNEYATLKDPNLRFCRYLSDRTTVVETRGQWTGPSLTRNRVGVQYTVGRGHPGDSRNGGIKINLSFTILPSSFHEDVVQNVCLGSAPH